MTSVNGARPKLSLRATDVSDSNLRRAFWRQVRKVSRRLRVSVRSDSLPEGSEFELPVPFLNCQTMLTLDGNRRDRYRPQEIRV